LIDLVPEGRLPLRIPLPFGYEFDPHVSYQLALTCALYPEACAVGVNATAAALFWTRACYGEFFTREGTKNQPKEGDAFTHCYWSGLITLQVGANKAEKVTTRFEAYGSENNKDEKDYDMDNNKRGRDYAQQFGAFGLAAEPLVRSYCRG
jgi:hypothetical protein